MEELIRQIHEMPIDDFEQQLHIHLSGLKKETDKLKIFIVLLLLAQKSLDVIKEMDLDDIIHQLKKKIETTTEEHQRYKETLQRQLSENDEISSILLNGKSKEDYQVLQEKINELLQQQEQILRYALTEHEQTPFEVIANKR